MAVVVVMMMAVVVVVGVGAMARTELTDLRPAQ
jgi:hypothetical protein